MNEVRPAERLQRGWGNCTSAPSKGAILPLFFHRIGAQLLAWSSALRNRKLTPPKSSKITICRTSFPKRLNMVSNTREIMGTCVHRKGKNHIEAAYIYTTLQSSWAILILKWCNHTVTWSEVLACCTCLIQHGILGQKIFLFPRGRIVSSKIKVSLSFTGDFKGWM